MEHQVVTDYSNVRVDNSNVKVYVRVRPPPAGTEAPAGMYEMPGDTPGRMTLRNPSNRHHGEHVFQFDKVFGTAAVQDELFKELCRPLVDRCLEGYNACCFAYGQTGSGKTYSMFGEGAERGVIPRAVDYLFTSISRAPAYREVAVLVTFLEMYCDQIRDLGRAYLDKHSGGMQKSTSEWFAAGRQHSAGYGPAAGERYESQNLSIHEDAEGNVFAKDACVIPVSTVEEVMTIVQMGFRLRATHETKMNAVSSRSHTIFTLTIVQKDKRTEERVAGTLNLVDLAGSERLDKSESEGQRKKEAMSINSSLSALGKVVMSLSYSEPREAGGTPYIPYRDSKLTRLLQNSLGGNSFTTLLATAHSTGEHYEETMSTLQFANRCRNVKNQPRVNYADQSMADKDRRIKRLLQEIAALRAQLETLQANVGQRMAAMAADLGLHGEVQADGTFLLDNGAVLGAPADSPLSAHVRGSDSVASVARSLARAIAAVQGAVAGSAAHRATATAAGSGAAAAAAAVAARGGADDGALDDGALDDGALAGMADGMLEEEELAAEEGAAGGRRPGSRAGRALFRGAAGVSLRRGNSVSSMAQLTDTLRVLESERRRSKAMREKLEELQRELRDLKARAREEQARMSADLAAARSQCRDLQAQLRDRDAAQAAAVAELQAVHDAQVQQLVAHSHELLSKQHALLKGVPKISARAAAGRCCRWALLPLGAAAAGRCCRWALLPLSAAALSARQPPSLAAPLHHSLRTHSGAMERAALAEARAREAAEERVREAVRAAQFEADARVEQERQRFQHWQQQQEQAFMRRAEAAEAEAATRAGEAQALASELATLYRHCNALTVVVQNMEQGKYPVRTRSGLTTFVISKSHKAAAALAPDPQRMRTLSQQLARSRALSQAADAADGASDGEDAAGGAGSVGGDASAAAAFTPGRPASASASNLRASSAAHPSAARHGGDVTPAPRPPRPATALAGQRRGSPAGAAAAATAATPSLAPSRASTGQLAVPGSTAAAPARPRSAAAARQLHANVLAKLQHDLQAEGSAETGEDALTLDLTSDLAAMTMAEARQQLQLLRTWLASGKLQRKIERHVLSDLTAHPTLEYIQALEAERDHYREQSAQAARRVQTLSVALRAQERALSKQRQQPGVRQASPVRATTPTAVHR